LLQYPPTQFTNLGFVFISLENKMNAIFTQIIARPDNHPTVILEVDMASDGSITITSKVNGNPSISIVLFNGEAEILRTMLRYAALVETPTRWDIGDL
jgi:hypothetical protein